MATGIPWCDRINPNTFVGSARRGVRWVAYLLWMRLPRAIGTSRCGLWLLAWAGSYAHEGVNDPWTWARRREFPKGMKGQRNG